MIKCIPLWIKCPVAVLLNQMGRLPLKLVFNNIYWSFIQNRNCTDAAKDRAYRKVQRSLCRYLSRKYGSSIHEICSNGSHGSYVENAPIWLFWWQGFQSAPEIIRICISNIQKNAGSHPVYVVDSQNYKDYVQIPEHIEQKLQRKTMSITHFSDYVRMKLLAEHGGLWIDSSIFAQSPIEAAVFEKPIWTLRNPGCDTTNISDWNWTIGVLGGWKNHALFLAVSEVLSRYWAEHNLVADYFMMDCVVRTVYDQCSLIKGDIDAVQPNNRRFYWLQENANQPFDAQMYQTELDSGTWLYKVSWKGQYEEKTADGRDTFYGRWKKDYGAAPR